MKVVKPEKTEYRTVTLRLPKKLMESVDKVAVDNDLSRQELIAAILRQVLNDTKFVLKVED